MRFVTTLRRMAMFAGFAATALIVAPMAAHAQTCLGQAEYEVGKWRVGALSRTSSEANLYAASLGTGDPGSQFLDGYYGKATVSSLPLTVTTWGLRTGGQIEFRGGSGLQLCPFVSVENTEGTYVNSGGTKVGTKGSFYALSAALGTRAIKGNEIELLPFVSGELRFATVTGAVEYEGLGGASGIASKMYETVTVGVGVVLHNAFTVRPTFYQPIGLKDGKSAVGFSFGWTF
jgi:hypothetical protein